jgi:uncharacterized protein YkwD/LysM repeat protein
LRLVRLGLTAFAGLCLVGLVSLTAGEAEASQPDSRLLQASDAYELIDAVNALRIANGLPAYNVHPTLMGTAQGQADYMASSGTVSHYGPDGSRPYQRALAAGYPVAGDLSAGGFFSENIIAGVDLSAQQAVNQWLGDAPHTNTMLSTYAQDIGAGVATAGGEVYYVIDVGLATGSTPRYTPGPGNTFPTAVFYAPLVSTIFPNTPAASGEVRHKVRSGETLWLIAITYGTKVDSIRALNNLSPDAPLNPGRDLLIFPAGTVTPPPPNRAGPTMLSPIATRTASGRSPIPSQTEPPASLTPDQASGNQATPPAAKPRASSATVMNGQDQTAPGISRSAGMGMIALIVGGSLLLAALLAFRNRSSG